MKPCVFCDIVAGRSPASIIYEDADVVALLDINPLQRGHTLVIPKRHYVDKLENEFAPWEIPTEAKDSGTAV